MKKYINKILSGALFLGLSVAAVSCSSDYLETVPTDSTGSGTAMATTDNLYAALNGTAKVMTTQHYAFSQGFAGENHVMNKMEDYPSDNYDYNYYASGWSPLFNQEFHYQVNSVYDSYAWYYYYTIIGNANSIIANVDAAEGLEADKKFIKASALTFRAFAYEKLARYYCYSWAKDPQGTSQGLIIQLDESIDGKPFSTLAETFAQIYKDCQDAITLFGESGLDRAAGEVWTPNVNVAHAVYARAALSKGDYDTAITQAAAAKKGYPLMSNSDYVAGFMEPIADKDYEFVDNIKGGAIPGEYVPSCDKGFKASMVKGSLIGFPIVGVKCTINDGQSHPVDSSDIAFQLAAQGAFREAYEKAKPCIMEPIMKVSIEGPTEFQGNIFGAINQRRGVIVSSTEDGAFSRVEAEVPLSEMFGFSTILRSLTQGKAEFSMEFEKYGKVPTSVSEKLVAEYQEKKRKEQQGK